LFDAAAAGYDVVVGSRFSRHSVLLNYPYQKVVANRGFHALAQLALRRRFRDLTNNLKLMRREVVERLQLLEPGFAVNAETGLQPLMMGFRVAEVPISWISRAPDMGQSRLLRVGGGYWRVLWRLWRHARQRPYSSLVMRRGVSTTWHRPDGRPNRAPDGPRRRWHDASHASSLTSATVQTRSPEREIARHDDRVVDMGSDARCAACIVRYDEISRWPKTGCSFR
jgi:hypothetical protein